MKTTKELARELGLLRKRTLSCTNAPSRGSNSVSTAQSFKYLIVIDFESTCWQDDKFRTQEIIEFPAVLLNTVSGEVESEFHHYVQPQEQPTLSSFCTELTGITQRQVDDGIPVNLCLKRFGHWLDKVYTEKGVVCQGTVTDSSTPVNTTCVTWSDWDLGVCLQYECKRKQLLKPAQLNSWIDLRATYRKFYDRKPNGLNGAMQDLGIEFQGREHSGVDDARNTAKLAFRMIRDGCHMKVTRNLKTHQRSVSCNPTILQYASKATRKTPPRKAKQNINTNTASTHVNTVSNNNSPQTNPTKIPVQIKTTKQSTSTYLTKAQCRALDSGQNKSKLGHSNNNTVCPNTESCSSHKRKQVTPVKGIENTCTESAPRKMARRFSPNKFSTADIYVDSGSSLRSGSHSDTGKTVNRTNMGLTVQDTNINGDRIFQDLGSVTKGHIISKQNKSNCFKKPRPVSSKSSEPLTFQVPQVSTTPNTGGGRESFRKGTLVISTPMNGNCHVQSFNRSRTISPVTNQLNGVSSSSGSVTSDTAVIVQSNSVSNKFGFMTPCQTPSFSSANHRTDYAMNYSSMKPTPPLCKCGRRSKRRLVQSPGQNMGRFFFSCSVRKQVGVKEGCEYFKWETSGMNTQLMAGSTSVVSKQFTPVMRGSVVQMPGGIQKRNLGVRTVSAQKVYLR